MRNLLILVGLFLFTTANAQVWDKVKKAAKRGVERTATKRAENEATEKTGAVIDIVTGKRKKKKKASEEEKEKTESKEEQDVTTNDNDEINPSAIQKKLIDKGSFSTQEIVFIEKTPSLDIDSALLLNEIGKAMQTSPEDSFLIIVFATDERSIPLATERAMTISQYLSSHFTIDDSKLISAGKNEKLDEDDDVKSPKRRNMRVGFNKL